MKTKTYLLISAVIFAVVCLGHLLRVIFNWPLVIDTYEVPMAVSWMGAVISGGLLVWAVTLLWKKRDVNGERA